jgi:hypothetical protein
MPAVGERGEALGLRVIDGFFPHRGETNPPLASGTTARESGPLPPGSDQRVVNSFRIVMELQLEINPLHGVTASWMGALGIIVMNVR